jgi:hypothetical protein
LFERPAGVGLLGDLCVVSRFVMTTRDRVVRADEDDDERVPTAFAFGVSSRTSTNCMRKTHAL